MSSAVNSSRNMLNYGKTTLKSLSDLINLTKEATEYNTLVRNANKFLIYEFKRNNTNAKNNFMKYIKILKLLYQYYIHYENLLKKYDEKNISELKLNIKNNNGKNLNADGIRRKIYEILVRHKLKLRSGLTKMREITTEEKIWSERAYNRVAKTFSTNKVLSKINFSNTPKTKEDYSKKIRNWVSEQNNVVQKIDNNIKQSLDSLNKIKSNIDKLYKNNNTNNPNSNLFVAVNN
jgi:hypothetical protein